MTSGPTPRSNAQTSMDEKNLDGEYPAIARMAVEWDKRLKASKITDPS